MRSEEPLLSMHEAACVTDVPLTKARRIIYSGLMGDFATIHKGTWMILKNALVGLKFAYEMTEFLTAERRRRLVGHVLEDPDAKTVRESVVSIDVRPFKNDVERGIESLDKAKGMISSESGILGGTPCFKGTRIPVHDIAAMLNNGNDVASILEAYPALTEAQVNASSIYAKAYPLSNRQRKQPEWRKFKPISSKRFKLDSYCPSHEISD